MQSKGICVTHLRVCIDEDNSFMEFIFTYDPSGGRNGPKFKMAAMKSSIFSLIRFYHTKTWYIKVFRYGKTHFDIYLILQKVCMTLMIQTGAPETPRGHLKPHPDCPLMALFRFHHTETWCIKVLRYGKIDFDIHLILQKICMTLMIQTGVSETQ